MKQKKMPAEDKRVGLLNWKEKILEEHFSPEPFRDALKTFCYWSFVLMKLLKIPKNKNWNLCKYLTILIL